MINIKIFYILTLTEIGIYKTNIIYRHVHNKHDGTI